VISLRTKTVDIALPVLNEEQTLETNVRAVMAELSTSCPYDWSLSIVDNGSTDSSWRIASNIALVEPKIRALRLGEPGRGGALRAAWTSSPADILAYMDIDLSTELEALGPLLDPIAAGTADISIGSRLAPASKVTRSAQREVISHLYNLIARTMLRYSVRDAQCGFKAVSRHVAQTIVPAIQDNSWFFDTELLVLASRRGLRINEVPVRWIEDDDSRVRIVNTAIDDLRGIWRLTWNAESDGSAGGGPDQGPVRVLETVSMASRLTAAGGGPPAAGPTNHEPDQISDRRS
jgi:glycosyltransferase involved in cell wall biosynthesis